MHISERNANGNTEDIWLSIFKDDSETELQNGNFRAAQIDSYPYYGINYDTLLKQGLAMSDAIFGNLVSDHMQWMSFM